MHDPEELEIEAGRGSPATRGLRPGRPLTGRVSPPGSKSLAIRSLLCAGLARGETQIEGLSGADDVQAALRVLRSVGVATGEVPGGRALVVGSPPAAPGAWLAEQPVDCGESGTLARLVTALLGLCPRPGSVAEVTARGSLRSRFSRSLLRALREAGAGVEELSARGSWPVRLTSAAPPPELRLVDPGSSQELSGLLLALAAHGGGGAIRVRGVLPSRPYAEMTAGVLSDFGVSVTERRCWWSVSGSLVAPGSALVIEPDASAAAVALAAGCLSGGEVEVPGFHEPSRQGDVAIARHLAAFGCRAELAEGSLRAGGRPRRGADLDLSGEPDLAPVLAAVAAAAALDPTVADEETRLRGLDTLNAKESRRIDVLAEGLVAVGVEVLADESSMRIRRGRGGQDEVVLDPRDDHRMAFAFALLGLVRRGVFVSSPDCVAKSWPSFWEDVRT